MNSELQTLLYPLGFIAGLLFGLRFTIQWLMSEWRRVSYVPPIFWMISLTANLIMCFHSLIQQQLNVLLIMVVNAVLSWRNLNLLGEKSKRISFRSVLIILALSLLFATALYITACRYLGDGSFVFVRTPDFLSGGHQLSPSWHLFGTVGFGLFCSRFWIQWWQSECAEDSVVSPLFWWISLIGAIASAAYFYMMNDLVNFIGPLLGIIPYIRNLMLHKRTE